MVVSSVLVSECLDTNNLKSWLRLVVVDLILRHLTFWSCPLVSAVTVLTLSTCWKVAVTLCHCLSTFCRCQSLHSLTGLSMNHRQTGDSDASVGCHHSVSYTVIISSVLLSLIVTLNVMSLMMTVTLPLH